MASDFSAWKKKLKKLDKIAEVVAPNIESLFQESVRTALMGFYDDYSPRVYERTYNFMSVASTARVSGRGEYLTFSVSSGQMSTYPGFSGRNNHRYEDHSNKSVLHPLQPSAAFDNMFIYGEHGNGKWLMAYTIPSPYLSVDEDIGNLFGGRAFSIINNAVKDILLK